MSNIIHKSVTYLVFFATGHKHVSWWNYKLELNFSWQIWWIDGFSMTRTKQSITNVSVTLTRLTKYHQKKYNAFTTSSSNFSSRNSNGLSLRDVLKVFWPYFVKLAMVHLTCEKSWPSNKQNHLLLGIQTAQNQVSF